MINRSQGCRGMHNLKEIQERIRGGEGVSCCIVWLFEKSIRVAASLMSLYPWWNFTNDSCRWNTLVLAFDIFVTLCGIKTPHLSFVTGMGTDNFYVCVCIFYMYGFLYMYRCTRTCCIHICIGKHTYTYLHMYKINGQGNKIALEQYSEDEC